MKASSARFFVRLSKRTIFILDSSIPLAITKRSQARLWTRPSGSMIFIKFHISPNLLKNYNEVLKSSTVCLRSSTTGASRFRIYSMKTFSSELNSSMLESQVVDLLYLRDLFAPTEELGDRKASAPYDNVLRFLSSGG